MTNLSQVPQIHSLLPSPVSLFLLRFSFFLLWTLQMMFIAHLHHHQICVFHWFLPNHSIDSCHLLEDSGSLLGTEPSLSSPWHLRTFRLCSVYPAKLSHPSYCPRGQTCWCPPSRFCPRCLLLLTPLPTSPSRLTKLYTLTMELTQAASYLPLLLSEDKKLW